VDRQISYLWKEPQAAAAYKTAVSLHGHTCHSKESLYFISEYSQDVPLLRWALAREERRARQKGGIRVDFLTSYWVPPVAPRTAFEIESKQIAEKLHLRGLVSLTDHDNIEAPTLLRMLPESAQIPISIEWSVPHGGTELHLGIHNLPPKCAQSMVREFNEYTERPSAPRLHNLLVTLHQMRDVLVVLNHPMWDLYRVGESHHKQAVSSFMAIFGQFVHAFELGGLRGWDENQRVIDFAIGWNQPVISGGDRHGREPNACVNLTDATTFSEFVDEVRHGRTHVLFMPQYAEPLTMRVIRVINEAIRSYPQGSLGADWDDRVFHPDREGIPRPLSQLWEKPPSYIDAVLSVIRLLESEPMRRAAQAFVRPEQQLHLTWSGEVP
jgi:hypothetical protein